MYASFAVSMQISIFINKLVYTVKYSCNFFNISMNFEV